METPSPAPALDTLAILDAVQRMYEDVASCPTKSFHFPTGRAACLNVGYPAEELDAIPATAVESFAGVGYPFAAGVICEGDTVVDVGSGSGTDLLIAARKTGPTGRVVGIDMTEAMVAKARANTERAGAAHVEVWQRDAEWLPLEDGTADVVTSNGVLNLVPDKAVAFREIWRVLRPGGRIQIADIVLSTPVSERSKANAQLWAECIVGAEPEEAYLALVREAGFEDVLVIDRLDYFAESTNEGTRRAASQYGAHTIVLTARKP
jgi:SAM-dependent methyltransferase